MSPFRLPFSFWPRWRAVSIIGVLALQVALGCESDRDKERVVWQYETYKRGWFSGDCTCAAPVISDNTLYFCGGYFWENKEQLVAVDLATYQEKWKTPMPGSCGPLLVKGGVIYKWDGKALVALDANTGELLRKRTDVTGLPFFFTDHLYVALKEGNTLEKLEPTTLKTVGSIPVSGVPSGTPLLEGDRVYFGTRSGKVCVVDLKAKAQVLAQKVADRTLTPLAKKGDVVFFAAERVDSLMKQHGYYLYALELSSQQIKWVVKGRALTQARPLVFDGKVFFSEARLYSIDLESGNERAYDISRGPGGNPVVSEGVLYVAGGKYMHSIDPSSGRMWWRFRADDWIDAPPTGPPPVIRNGTIYFCSLDCNVYALKTAASTSQ